ncbi:phosphoenolpyruvate synthase [Rossellomorea sp. SC111]|uniref:phosphoenolpyruvate synthase n=1 Tax=Rossellomorea sp. SC111 TaxID=2968985 RepID=UPI00215AACBC|nr:phosphoenolpyruvate synthase [Rossellomorea sp. SC111]MCR8848491.1 phosphoenolpyruvate synthase [Rossellomorea sp. SC111]
MDSLVLSFHEMEQSELSLVGGKGLNLGLLSTIQGIQVPEGFSVTTVGFQRAVEQIEMYHTLLARLSKLNPEDRNQIGEVSKGIRDVLLNVTIPTDVVEAVTHYHSRFGEEHAYAVRSSATAEDLPLASFAGQQDSYLHIIGKDSILKHIRKCWASLFTDRAVIYRMQNGFDHSQVHLSVIVQRMVSPQVSGILFTADPVSSNRKVLSIDAGFGLGEALVSGMVSPDSYQVKDGMIIDKRIETKKLAIYGVDGGGTVMQPIPPDQQKEEALTDEQVLRLSRIGRKIEAHFDCPQDIEWCLEDDSFYIVQSRPITTLYPIPEAIDGENRVYLSVGHQQMMTDAMKPLGLSFFLLTTPAPMKVAGGRLFVDCTPRLASPASRQSFIELMGKSEPLIKDALTTIVERQGFIKTVEDEAMPAPRKGGVDPIDPDPAIVAELMEKSESSIEQLKRTIHAKTGSELIDFILEDMKELKRILFDPESSQVIMAAMDALFWINDHMYEWLGEKNVADTLSQSVPNNITSEMGLALMDVADVIRPHQAVIDYLRQEKDDNFLDELVKVEGGQEARNAIKGFLTKYGMRCSGEIDISRVRWSEKPTTIVPMILSNIEQFEPQESKRKFEKGRLEALEKERELLDRLSSLPDGEQKVKETKRRIEIIRHFTGYREYPKYGMIQRYFAYKQALLKEAERLVEQNILQEKEDIFYLAFDELQDLVRAHEPEDDLICKRKEEFNFYEKLTPPRVITSDGEIITGEYKREDLPAAALAGLAVSSGVIEGRARVIVNMEDANLEEGDILVTAYTDPSWTPLFVSIKGLVTEVGGLMTHGAVIAREYGLPAVVGVERATERIRDGQRIRVHGTEGYVEIL